MNRRVRNPALLLSTTLACLAHPQSPTQNPNGVIPLPQGPPTTTQQAPVPNAVLQIPPADTPLLASPNLAPVRGFAESRPLKIEDAVAIALYTNRPLAAAIANLQAAQARTGEARAGLNPTFGVNSQLNYYDKATSFNLPSAPGTASNGFTIIPQYNPVNTAAFTLPIDIAGSLHAAVSQAQYNEVASRLDVNKTRNQIIADVKASFYNALRAQAQLAVQTDNVNEALARLSDAQKNYSAGTSPYIDILTTQRDVANAQQALLAAQAEVSTALTNLENTIGLRIGTKLSISSEGAVEYPAGVQPPAVPATAGEPNQPPVHISNEEPKTAPESNYTPLPLPRTDVVQDPLTYGPDYQSLVREALDTRAEIFETKAQVEAAQKGVQFARRSSLPSVSLSLTYVNTPKAAGFSRKNEGLATLGISLPIFDGGLDRARVSEARAGVAAGQINQRQAQDQVELDVQQAYVALVQARNRVAVTNVELAQARESFRLVRIRYNAGLSAQPSGSPQLELINAQTGLTLAQTDHVNALYDYNNARAQLDRAIGRYSYVGIGPGYLASPLPNAGQGK